MKFFISHHQHKGKSIAIALKKHGWLQSAGPVDVALFDHGISKQHPDDGRILLNNYFNRGSTIITYPHGSTGAWWMDNDAFPPNPRIFANLVNSEGRKHVEQIIQPTLEHHVIGWNYCSIRPFRKPDRIKTILFAPIHASAKNFKLREECIDVNARVYKALLGLGKEYKIIVRYLNPLEKIGLRYTSRMTFVAGKPDGSFTEIDLADLVIAEGTYMYLAVARGKPTIGMNQHIPIRLNDSDRSFKLNHWNEYEKYMAYPIDFDDSADIRDLINRAATEEQSKWKELFIGNTMDSKVLSDLLIELRTKDINTRK